MRGGAELMMNGYQIEPAAVTQMAVVFPVFVLSLLDGIALRAVRQDVP